MSSIWYTSDLHFGHQLVSEIRGFGSTEAHDATVMRLWESVVGPQDTVYVLGDLTVDNRKTEYALGLVSVLPGTKHLIAGNHDAVASIHRAGWKHLPAYLDVFASVRDFAKVRMRKQDVLLSHYPYSNSVEADHGRVRYEQFRLPDYGVPLIHGHTHLAHQRLHYTRGWADITEGDVYMRDMTPQVHVGLDAWGLAPVRSDVVEALLFESKVS